MRKKIIPTICFFYFLAISINVSAQAKASKGDRKIVESQKEDFQEFANDYKAMGEKTRGSYEVASNYEKKYNLKNNFCTAENYTVPKKVGILSFYIDDETYSTTTSDAYSITTTTYKASSEKVNVVAQRIYEQSLSALKERYTLLGIDLLTPEEFLTTEEQKNTYYNAPLNNLDGKSDVFKLLGSGSAVPAGFRFLPYASYFIYTGKEFAKEKDAYLNALGLDAYIVVAIKLSASGGSLHNITSAFIFKNPGYDNSDKVGQYLVGYTPYTATYVAMNFGSPMPGIFLKEEKEYTNKKGKQSVKFVPVDVDPNLANLVTYTVERDGKRAVSQIPIKDKKKKKKK